MVRPITYSTNAISLTDPNCKIGSFVTHYSLENYGLSVSVKSIKC